MNSSSVFSASAGLFLAMLCGVGTATASNLVYHPLNPSFGGNPNLSAWYFELASAQNKTGDGSGGNGGGTDFGSGIGGPVIIINPGDTNVGAPSVDTGDDEDVP